MPRLQILKGLEIITALRKIGYAQTRQRGSHIRLEAPEGNP
ncbi:MAG: type II toxin-antitoxin system HicA family toxin [Ignavibacteria bacterium]|nr:type II toxin-antitoxin system HicA family toxin [Ignavibacteria bacterium]